MNSFKQLASRALHDEGSKPFVATNVLLSLAIVISVITVILQTVPEYAATYNSVFYLLEAFFLGFFVIEYILRIYTAPKAWKYLTSPLGILDLICILPGLVLLGAPFQDLAVLWVFRLLRVLRLLRTIRLVRFIAPSERARSRMGRILSHIHWINLEIYAFSFLLVIVFSSTLMFLAEGHLPDTHFPTIPDGMWWAVVTVTTVGDGDLVPITIAGKVIATLTMIAGLALFALMLVVVGNITQKLLFGTRIER
jgi:voltage-gated potassium channel